MRNEMRLEVHTMTNIEIIFSFEEILRHMSVRHTERCLLPPWVRKERDTKNEEEVEREKYHSFKNEILRRMK